MAKEHAERQMIERALVGMVEREEEHALSKIDRMRNKDEGRMGIALVKVHKELVVARNRAKDMVRKNKTGKKAEKYAKHCTTKNQNYGRR